MKTYESEKRILTFEGLVSYKYLYNYVAIYGNNVVLLNFERECMWRFLFCSVYK